MLGPILSVHRFEWQESEEVLPFKAYAANDRSGRSTAVPSAPTPVCDAVGYSVKRSTLEADGNKYVILKAVEYSISYYSASVQEEILNLPDTLAARYVVLTRRMLALGPNLGEPHSKAFGDGLFELRLKGAEGIARVFYGTLVGRRIVMLHSFVKKSQKTPRRELDIAERRLKEVKDGHA